MTANDSVPYWRLSGFYFLFFLTLGAFMPYWSPYLKSLGMNAEEIGILSAIIVFNKIFLLLSGVGLLITLVNEFR